ncbi:MAG: hypothetical protein B7X48_05415 [Acidiphilium sp. 34-60-192]|nr:MAG: hypothetical protein B7X48_05415 [Acidiphilium sp. 34-60-192]
MDRAQRAHEVSVSDMGLIGEVLAGLTATPKTLPPKLFYDAEGCALFGAITELPEYYLTRAETAILRTIAPDLATLLPAQAALVEYGASDEAKGAILIGALAPRLYMPIDIADGALADLQARMAHSHPTLPVQPLVADFMQPLVMPSGIGDRLAFLRRARADLGAAGALVIGVDLEKSPARLIPAYDDAACVTARFNLNMLARLNREAGADFVLERFAHQVIWNAAQHRIEMHLRSEVAQVVMVAGQAIHFAAGETIHTENSHKYAVPRFQVLASRAGWHTDQVWTDADGLFAVYLLR